MLGRPESPSAGPPPAPAPPLRFTQDRAPRQPVLLVHLHPHREGAGGTGPQPDSPLRFRTLQSPRGPQGGWNVSVLAHAGLRDASGGLGADGPLINVLGERLPDPPCCEGPSSHPRVCARPHVTAGSARPHPVLSAALRTSSSPPNPGFSAPETCGRILGRL